MPRQSLRADLLAARARYALSAEAAAAGRLLNDHVIELLAVLEPDLLGLYWAVRSEFNLGRVIERIKAPGHVGLSLPYAQVLTSSMEFRRWDGEVPDVKDECGIPSSIGAPVEPDVVIVPCVGFTRSGYRIGYGGGYFDRWLVAHPHVTAVGVAWSGSEVSEAVFAAQPHDVPMSVIVTEEGVVG